jgi:hypothetical protein
VDFSDLLLPCGFKRFLSLPLDSLWILGIYRYLCGSKRFYHFLWISVVFTAACGSQWFFPLKVDFSDLSLPCGFKRFLLLPVDFPAAIASISMRAQRGEKRSIPSSRYMPGALL